MNISSCGNKPRISSNSPFKPPIVVFVSTNPLNTRNNEKQNLKIIQVYSVKWSTNQKAAANDNQAEMNELLKCLIDCLAFV